MLDMQIDEQLCAPKSRKSGERDPRPPPSKDPMLGSSALRGYCRYARGRVVIYIR